MGETARARPDRRGARELVLRKRGAAAALDESVDDLATVSVGERERRQRHAERLQAVLLRHRVRAVGLRLGEARRRAHCQTRSDFDESSKE